jgi:hypothetical protein
MKLLSWDGAVVALVARIDVAKLIASWASALDLEVLSLLNLNTHNSEVLKVDWMEFSFTLMLVGLSRRFEPLAWLFLLNPELELQRELFVVIIFVPQEAIHF